MGAAPVEEHKGDETDGDPDGEHDGKQLYELPWH
jgi:hypothetical protein